MTYRATTVTTIRVTKVTTKLNSPIMLSQSLFTYYNRSIGCRFLSHALKYTANQRPELLLHILQYATGSTPLYFPVITCAQQFTEILLRTSQKSDPKLFNSYEPLRTFPITSRNFPMIFEHFRRFCKRFFENLKKS